MGLVGVRGSGFLAQFPTRQTLISFILSFMLPFEGLLCRGNEVIDYTHTQPPKGSLVNGARNESSCGLHGSMIRDQCMCLVVSYLGCQKQQAPVDKRPFVQMGIADERLVSPGAVPQALRCAICTEVFSDPVCGAGECQHVFCRPCVTEALARKRECPMCRSRMNPHKLRISQPMQSVLDEIPVRCAHHMLGCFWSGRLDGSRAHETACLVPELQRAKGQIQELQVAKDLIAELKLENQSLERSLQRKTAELFDATWPRRCSLW